MPLLVQGVSEETGRLAALLILRVLQRILDTLGTLGILFPGILVVLPGFSRGPLVQGHYSFVGGRLMSSIVFVGDYLVPSGHRIAFSHSRMCCSVCCSAKV